MEPQTISDTQKQRKGQPVQQKNDFEFQLLKSFICGEQGTENVIKDINEVIKKKKLIKQFFRSQKHQMKKIFAVAHTTIKNILDLKIPIQFLHAFLKNIAKFKSSCKNFMNKQALRKLKQEIPLSSLPLYCSAFQIKIQEKKILELTLYLIENNFVTEFQKLVQDHHKTIFYRKIVEIIHKSGNAKMIEWINNSSFHLFWLICQTKTQNFFMEHIIQRFKDKNIGEIKKVFQQYFQKIKIELSKVFELAHISIIKIINSNLSPQFLIGFLNAMEAAKINYIQFINFQALDNLAKKRKIPHFCFSAYTSFQGYNPQLLRSLCMLIFILVYYHQTSKSVINAIIRQTKNFKFEKIREELHIFFSNNKNQLQKVFKIINITLIKILESTIPWNFLNAFFIIIKNFKNYGKKLINYDAVEKLQHEMPLCSLPFYFYGFQIKIQDEKLQDLLKCFIEKKSFFECFLLIEINGKKLNHLKMLTQKYTKIKKKDKQKLVQLIITSEFGAKQFPQIQSRLVGASFNYFNKKGWEFCEEIFDFYPKQIAKLVKKIIKKHQKNISLSICQRNPQAIKFLKSQKNLEEQIEQIVEKNQIIPNRLKTNKFLPSDSDKYFSFAEFKISDKDVIFVDPSLPIIQNFLQDIVKQDQIGIDTQSILTTSQLTKPKDLLALIQVSTSDKVYLFDPLQTYKPIVGEYLSKFFDDPEKKVIGHTIQQDFSLTLKAFSYDKKEKCQVIDVKNIFKSFFPNQKVGLTSISQKVLGKPICKEYTFTNWARRPLLLNQIHYAAMDAFIVLKIYDKLDSMMKQK